MILLLKEERVAELLVACLGGDCSRCGAQV